LQVALDYNGASQQQDLQPPDLIDGLMMHDELMESQNPNFLLEILRFAT